MPDIDAETLERLLPPLVALRHAIHRHPDLSGQEAPTARRLLDYLAPLDPDQVIAKIGGCGLAVVFAGSRPGPTTVFTSELDAVPIGEQGRQPYRSRVPGVGHMCGHDGHMAAVAGLGPLLERRRPLRGRVVLLFRPQEETGRGAPAVVSDPRLMDLKPDYLFGFHNMPGYPLGSLLFRRGQFAWAATDYVVELVGKSSHGGQPGAGRSPAAALATIVARLEDLGTWSGLDPTCNASQAAYAVLGESDHGTTPGVARLRATLRSQRDGDLKALCRQVTRMIADIARSHGLQWTGAPENWIPDTHSDPQALEMVLEAARQAGLPVQALDQPQRWSDDFGVLTRHHPGAFFGVGSGSACGQLHGPDFDFPDAVLEPVLRLYWALVVRINGVVEGMLPHRRHLDVG